MASLQFFPRHFSRLRSLKVAQTLRPSISMNSVAREPISRVGFRLLRNDVRRMTGKRYFHLPTFLRRSSTTASSSSSSTSSSTSNSDSKAGSFKALLKKHGATAVVIYILLSGVDLGVTWAAIYAIGADRVREFEDFILHHLHWTRSSSSPSISSPPNNDTVPSDISSPSIEENKDNEGSSAIENGSHSIFWTTFALAYAIHKTLLLPFRLGVTAAVTPRAVRLLRARGWNVGGGTGAPR